MKVLSGCEGPAGSENWKQHRESRAEKVVSGKCYMLHTREAFEGADAYPSQEGCGLRKGRLANSGRPKVNGSV